MQSTSATDEVTVGVKPETIAAAEGLAGNIGASVAGQPTTGSKGNKNAATGDKQPLTNVDEYSNTKDAKKF
jgi:hypothetical protein